MVNPMGPYGAPAARPIVLRPGTVMERSSVMVLVLGLVTCGIYLLYWLYKTSEELKNATDDASINPGMDLLLTLVTCGMWGLYLQYRNAQKIHQVLLTRDPNHKDQSQTVMILILIGFAVGGVTGIIATYLVQEEFNMLAKAAG